MEMNGNSREAVFQEIISLADAMADRLTARRRDFHKYAETGWFLSDCKKTDRAWL